MSLIGITSLNATVKEEGIFEPSLILENLRYHLINALGQKGEIGERSDGIDLSVAVINHTASIMEYAGAMSQGFLLRNKKIEIFKGDRISIGFDQRDKNFTTKTFFLKPNDVIYLFSDGLVDQFGGPDSQKLKTSRFKDFVLSIANKSLEEQEKEITAFIKDWMGYLPQLDDMLVLAFRL
jgi:serine phosphatase RsbU (regulator of sigma subunit)